jgi:hypothetical protein
MLTPTDLDRIEDLATEAGLDPATTPFDTLVEWLLVSAGRHYRDQAQDVVRALKVRALQRAS